MMRKVQFEMEANKNEKLEYWKRKIKLIKEQIIEFVHENAALCDEVHEIQERIIMRNEERKFLLRKLCLFEPQTELEVETLSKVLFSQATSSNHIETKKVKRKLDVTNEQAESTINKHKKILSKQKKKLISSIPLDTTGRPIFPIQLGSITIHSLGEILTDRKEFHTADFIYPVGYVSTKIYCSWRDPMAKCVYTCKISEASGEPRFEISPEDNSTSIIGGTPDICHSLLLEKINEVMSFNVVTTRPKGHDFFGLTHPVVMNLIQCSPGSRKCINYKWRRFEISKQPEHVHAEDRDTTLCYESLQRSIDQCKFRMVPSQAVTSSTSTVVNYFAGTNALTNQLLNLTPK